MVETSMPESPYGDIYQMQSPEMDCDIMNKNNKKIF